MPTRDLSNRRIQIWLGLANSIADSQYRFVTDDELAAMLMAAPAVRWDGLDFGMQASDQIDDRSLDDDAAFTLRGFLQAGGGLPLFFPKPTDLSSNLREVYELVKVPGTDLALVERIGWKDRREAGAVGDIVNIYKVQTDGFLPDTEGDGGYAYQLSMLPQGLFSTWSVVADTTPITITTSGGAISGAAGTMYLRRATLSGNDITRRAIWESSDQDIAIVDDGIVELIGTGSATIKATYPGATDSATIAVTVS